MKLSDELLGSIAECVSKGIHLTLDVVCDGEPVDWCDKCEERSVVDARVRGISADAVYELGTVRACAKHEAGDD